MKQIHKYLRSAKNCNSVTILITELISKQCCRRCDWSKVNIRMRIIRTSQVTQSSRIHSGYKFSVFDELMSWLEKDVLFNLFIF